MGADSFTVDDVAIYVVNEANGNIPGSEVATAEAEGVLKRCISEEPFRENPLQPSTTKCLSLHQLLYFWLGTKVLLVVLLGCPS